MAAAVADFRPARAARAARSRRRATSDLERRLERTPDILAGLAAAPRRADARRLRGRARRRRARGTAARSSRARALDAIVVNDMVRAGHRLRRRRQRGDDHHRRRASATCRGPPRPRSRERSWTRSIVLRTPRDRPAWHGGVEWSSTEAEQAAGHRRGDRGGCRARPADRAEHRDAASRCSGEVARRPRRRRCSPRGTCSSRTSPASARRRWPARSRARSTLEFARVQCTADLLPADVVGTNVFNQREGRFEFRPGPIFANVVLVDEINRASPEDAVGPARVHAGAPRDRRRPHARARPAVRRARDAEPGRVRGHLPAARGAGRPLHGAPVARLPVAAGEAEMLAAPRGRRPRRASSSPSPTPPTVLAAQDAALRVHASRGAAPVRRRAARAHARRTRASSSARALAPA